MITTIKTLFKFSFFLKEINLAFSKGALGASVRKINENDPLTWQFSAFSQNGEDGIIDFLTSNIIKPNRYFIEIGSSNGLANNTAYLALVKKYCGIMVEGGKMNSSLSRIIYRYFNSGIESLNMFVTKENVNELLEKSIHSNPDVFSIDIDGNDYYLVESLLNQGFRPSVLVAEYNANFGPNKSITIPYSPAFNYSKAHSTRLYYGVSIMAWRNLLQRFNYDFITVDSNGINVFFINSSAFPEKFINNISGIDFLDNVIESQTFKKPWHDRFKYIENMPYELV